MGKARASARRALKDGRRGAGKTGAVLKLPAVTLPAAAGAAQEPAGQAPEEHRVRGKLALDHLALARERRASFQAEIRGLMDRAGRLETESSGAFGDSLTMILESMGVSPLPGDQDVVTCDGGTIYVYRGARAAALAGQQLPAPAAAQPQAVAAEQKPPEQKPPEAEKPDEVTAVMREATTALADASSRARNGARA